MTPENEEREKHDAASKLREDFLRAVYSLTGQKATILTYEKTELEGVFSGWNTDGSDILIKDMKTPSAQTWQSALMRTPDILNITFDNPICRGEN